MDTRTYNQINRRNALEFEQNNAKKRGDDIRNLYEELIYWN